MFFISLVDLLLISILLNILRHLLVFQHNIGLSLVCSQISIQKELKKSESYLGYHYIENLLNRLNIKLEVINNIENKDKEIVDDFISIITSFCGKIYGSKRKAKTERIIKELNEEETSSMEEL